MGVALPALAALLLLVTGALATAWLEPRLVPQGADPGAAAPVSLEPDRLPETADRWMYPAGPVMALVAVTLGAVVIPFGKDLVVADLTIGVFYFLVVVDIFALGLSLGGWGANQRQAVEVYYRATAQLVAYVVPLGLAYIGAIMMAESLSTVSIVEAQKNLPFLVLQPIGFALYLVTGLMQCYRAPFQEPLARTIEHGLLPVYGGWKAAVWRVALSGLLFVVGAMGAVLFLGGWHGPLLPGWLWMLLKTFAMIALMVWLGRRFEPLSTARMLELSWKVLTPVGLVNVLIVGGLILLGVGPA